MTDKEKIRAEIIKRRKAIPKEEDDKRMKAVYGGIIFELTEILEFIDSLPVEPKFMVGQVVRSSNGTILKIIGIGQYCYHCDNGYSFGFDIQDEFELVGKSARDDLKEEDSFDELLQKLYIKYNKEVSLEKLLDIASNFVKWQKVQLIKSAELDGWIARDEDDRLHLFEVEPRRLEKEHRWWDRDYHRTGLDESDFPDLKWEDEPVYVKLPIIVED